jgi:hypothetical protein
MAKCPDKFCDLRENHTGEHALVGAPIDFNTIIIDIDDDVTVDAWRENTTRQVLREMNHWNEPGEWSMAEFLITQLREAGVFDHEQQSLINLKMYSDPNG